MFLGCRRKPDWPEKTHACMETTSKIHPDKSQAGCQTQDPVAARQQCYQLCHLAALDYKVKVTNTNECMYIINKNLEMCHASVFRPLYSNSPKSPVQSIGK
ncbi:hypothetical protein ATANTOWER_008388 [Ataeniobius toweri]|uniref:Uncharacterized protein n=1 Tax=Ataeniobius toweri TaxID=208326 RepID=A0ABU7BYF1_9TELE|nr:hypothetical protein [Ataeniobius toweri]